MTDPMRTGFRRTVHGGEAPPAVVGWRWAVVRRSIAAILLDACRAREIPAAWEPPRSFLGLQRFIFALELHWQAECPAELPPDLLAAITARPLPFAQAAPIHLLAASTRVAAPTDADVLALASELARLSAALRTAPRPPAAAALAAATADILTAQSTPSQRGGAA